MKKILLIFAFVLTATMLSNASDKIELKWKKLDAGITEAKKTKKKILVDIYATWCKWCKKLDAEVYTNDKIAKYLEKHYVLVKLNGESNEQVSFKDGKMSEQEITQGFGVTGFPTIIFLEPNGDAINKLGGFVDAEKFFPIIQYIGEEYYKNMSWQEYQKKSGLAEKVK